MKKIILTLILSLLMCSNVCAKNRYITTGGYYFASTKSMLQTALYHNNRGDHSTVTGFIASGIIKVFPPGLPVELYTSGAIVRVYFRDNPKVIWWTTRAALSHR